MRGTQLVDVHAEALQQRLLELQLHGRPPRRIDARVEVGQLIGVVNVMPATPPVGNGLSKLVVKVASCSSMALVPEADRLERLQRRADGLVGGVPASGWSATARRTWTATTRYWSR